MEIRAIDFVVYPVTDFRKGVEFYTQVMGLEVESIWHDQYAEFDIAGQTFTIMSGVKELKPGGAQVAFNVPDVKKALEEIKAKGVKQVGEIIDTPVCRMAFILDPDGNAITLHEKPKV